MYFPSFSCDCYVFCKLASQLRWTNNIEFKLKCLSEMWLKCVVCKNILYLEEKHKWTVTMDKWVTILLFCAGCFFGETLLETELCCSSHCRHTAFWVSSSSSPSSYRSLDLRHHHLHYSQDFPVVSLLHSLRSQDGQFYLLRVVVGTWVHLN